VDLVRQKAADLGVRLARESRRSASIAQERAILRMLGVDGLDHLGRPLAASVSDRYAGADLDRLAAGVLLPLTVAMLEYELPPRELALEVASGAIDLQLEAELLERPDRRLVAEQRATALFQAAVARIDANRTATREMREVLGLPPEPRLGVAVRSSEVEPAAAEVRSLVGQGAGVVEIRVPTSWELSEVRRQAGMDGGTAFGSRVAGSSGGGRPGREPDSGSAKGLGRGRTAAALAAVERSRLGARRRLGEQRNIGMIGAEGPVPAGSQRGLAELRKAADEAGAERSCYASLMTVTSAFAAPEQAVVAAFERIDYVEADPIREIVEDNVDPERALADHSFAHRIEARAGSRLLLGAGPLALGADVAAGVPSGAATRAGRALALQALGVELALADGLRPEQVLLSCIPSWIVGESDTGAALLQAFLRRLTFPDHGLVVVGPVAGLTTPSAAGALATALAASEASLVLDRGVRDVAAAASDLASIASGVSALRSAFAGDQPRAGLLRGEAAELAARILDEALSTLERLSSEGWTSLLGPSTPGDPGDRLGRSAVADRSAGPGTAAALVDRFF
jgi:hypothetical protein